MTHRPPTADTPLTIVTASRLTAEAFPAESLLGRSLRLSAHQDCDTRIHTANREPLGAIYNQALEALQRLKQWWAQVGSRRILPGQPTWWLQPDGRTWDHPHLVGTIRHGDPGASEPIRFGASPAPAMLLDGVFLAARAGTLQAAGVRFDPAFPFHFYDLDLCRSALAAGLRLGIWPLPLIHASPGAAGSPDWQLGLERYRRKWEPSLTASPSHSTPSMTSAAPTFEITTSRQLLSWLAEQHLSLALTTYQIGKLFSLGLKANGELAVFERTFNRCMGLCPSGNGNGFFLSSLYQIWRFENMLGPGEQADGFDRLYVPQLGSTTGDCDIHDMAVTAEGQLVFVNTLFSCLATTSSTHSFRPLWRPPFISRLAAEDRCHLNGLALRDGQPGFVTAVSTSDAADGWRERRRDGGVLIDVQANEIVASGLSMPHSPRWHQDRLWLCNSGTGEFGTIDLASGRFEPLTFCAGYLRGVAFLGNYALLGTSKPRHTKTFSGLPLDDALAQRNVEARCGIQVVDLRTGDALHWIRFEGLVEEIYDVITLPGVRNPSLIGFVSDEIRRLIAIEAEP